MSPTISVTDAHLENGNSPRISHQQQEPVMQLQRPLNEEVYKLQCYNFRDGLNVGPIVKLLGCILCNNGSHRLSRNQLTNS